MNLDNLPSDEHLRSRWTAIESATQKRSASRLRRTSLVGLLVVGLVGGSSFAAFAAHEASVSQQTAEQEMDFINEQAATYGLLNEEQDDWFQRFYNVAVGPGKADSDDYGWPEEYGGTAIDMKTRVQTVWWVGRPPEDVRDFLAEPTTEFTVKVEEVSVGQPARYRAARQIISADVAHPLVEGLHVQSVSHTQDRTALVVEYVIDEPPLADDAEENLLAAAREISDVSVARVERTEAAVFLPAIIDRIPTPTPAPER